jgi:hypothetical protein
MSIHFVHFDHQLKPLFQFFHLVSARLVPMVDVSLFEKFLQPLFADLWSNADIGDVMATSESARMAYNAGDCTAEIVGLDEFA